MSPFDFKPQIGITVRTAEELRAMSRELARLSSMFPRAGGSENTRTQESCIVKLTAQNGATPPVYSGTEQSFDVAGDYEDMPNGRLFTPSNMPIYERNGTRITSFPYYTEVSRRILVDGVPTYEFSSDSSIELRGLTFTSNTGATSGDPGAGKFLWNNATQSSATGLTFNTATSDDVTVSSFWTALTTSPPRFIFLQQADDASKWQLWQCSAATNATTPLVATVSIVGFGGSIADGKVVLTDFYGSADASATQAGTISFVSGTAQILGEGTKVAQRGIGSDLGAINTPWRAGTTYIGKPPSGVSDWGGMIQTPTAGSGAYDSVALLLRTDVTQPWCLLVYFDAAGAARNDVQPAYAVWNINTVNIDTGVTATLGPGCATTGGIVTNAGTGTFGTISTQNSNAVSITGGSASFTGALSTSDSFTLSGDISPAQLTGDVDNWNPTGW